MSDGAKPLERPIIRNDFYRAEIPKSYYTVIADGSL